METVPPDADHATSIGWISIAELFLIVGVILLASVIVVQGHLDSARTDNTKLQESREALRLQLEEQIRLATERHAEIERQRQRLSILADADRHNRDLQRQLAESQASATRLAEQLARTAKERDDSRSEVAELRQQVKTLTTARDQLQAELASANSQLKEAREAEARAVARASKLEAEVEALRVALRRAEADKRTRDEQAAELEKKLRSYENRFEGLRIGGQRVVFLIDQSGSMDGVAPGKPEPQKWPTVCETVRRIMNSNPDLKQYQVITFSTGVHYPKGEKGKWLDFTPGKSPDEVHKALLQVKPTGGTNLYAGLEAAFQLRASGLDAVYLFSDGLPNDGPGLTDEDRKAISQLEKEKSLLAERVRGERLGEHVRSTMRKEWNRGPQSVRVESVGFFYESPDLGAFLWALSRENGGNFVGLSKP